MKESPSIVCRFPLPHKPQPRTKAPPDRGPESTTRLVAGWVEIPHPNVESTAGKVDPQLESTAGSVDPKLDPNVNDADPCTEPEKEATGASPKDPTLVSLTPTLPPDKREET